MNGDRYADSFIDDMTLGHKWNLVTLFVTMWSDLVSIPRENSCNVRVFRGINVFQSGHVRTIKLLKCNNDGSIAKAMMNPSQSTPDKGHKIWIAHRKVGEVIAAR